MKKEKISIYNWSQAPHNRESFQYVQRLFPTHRLKRGLGPVSDLPSETYPIEDLEFVDVEGKNRNIRAMLDETYTDAFLVLKDGKLIHEEYMNNMQPDSFHLLNSISKSFLGMLIGILNEKGIIDTNKKVREYIPELNESAFPKTTVQHALDMAGAVNYVEDYSDSKADFWKETSVVGWRPDLIKEDGPKSLLEFAASLTDTEQEDGKIFHYRTVFTNILALVAERAAGESVQDLLEKYIWQRLGPEQDAAIVVDQSGLPYMGAGMNTCARDLARFGQMILNDGYFNGQQIVPEDWIKNIRMGNKDLKRMFAESHYGPMLPNGHYTNQVWVDNSEIGTFICLGIYGQTILINQSTGVVIVKFSTHPGPEDEILWGNSTAAIMTLAMSL
tara:strand:- start:11717 stop:12880 length:1164 start_codon:yes stop_codon:yes gene_type:complete